MNGNLRRFATASAFVLGLASASHADDAATAKPAAAVAPPVVAPQRAAEPVAPAPEQPGGLRSAVESMVGTSVHGDLTLRYRARWTHSETDQDLYEYLNLHLGDENRDPVSGTLFIRATQDLDGAHDSSSGGYTFDSLADTFDSSFNVLMYSAYATVRPKSGPVESYRIGRQYVYAGETFHYDGATVTTRALVDSVKLKLTAYGGVPVHFYESSGSGDWLAGARASADPWQGGRAALDYTHVQDDLSILGKARNDLAALSMWQTVSKHTEVYGQYTWLEGPRDATLRGTYSLPDDDFIVQGSYYRLFESMQQFATEFDPYFSVIKDLDEYHEGDVHVTKGFGKNFDVEVGGMARQLVDGDDTGAFNRDTRRIYVTPTVTDLPWEGTSVSVTGESLTGDGERLQTWAVDASHRFTRDLKVSAGSDYSLYAFGPLGEDERSHVRTAYARIKARLSKSLTADVQYTWEKDDVETFHVISLALVFEF